MSKCARLRWEETDRSVVARDAKGNLVGALYLHQHVRGMDEELIVGTVRVADTHQRCGVGTQLYTRAAAIARKLRMPLVSDSTRSEAAEMFWQKQERKGRATCARKGKGAAKLAWNPTTGFSPARGRWSCQQYVLKPDATDLSGLKAKRKPAKKRRRSR